MPWIASALQGETIELPPIDGARGVATWFGDEFGAFDNGVRALLATGRFDRALDATTRVWTLTTGSGEAGLASTGVRDSVLVELWRELLRHDAKATRFALWPLLTHALARWERDQLDGVALMDVVVLCDLSDDAEQLEEVIRPYLDTGGAGLGPLAYARDAAFDALVRMGHAATARQLSGPIDRYLEERLAPWTSPGDRDRRTTLPGWPEPGADPAVDASLEDQHRQLLVRKARPCLTAALALDDDRETSATARVIAFHLGTRGMQLIVSTCRESPGHDALALAWARRLLRAPDLAATLDPGQIHALCVWVDAQDQDG